MYINPQELILRPIAAREKSKVVAGYIYIYIYIYQAIFEITTTGFLFSTPVVPEKRN